MSGQAAPDPQRDLIERLLEALATSKGGPTRTDGENGKSIRRIAEALVIAALGGLGASLWVLKGTVEVQQASIQFLQKQVDTVTAESHATTRDVAEMQGRFYRGLEQGKDPYATGKQ